MYKIHVLYTFYTVDVSQYSEYDEENLALEHDDTALNPDTPAMSDDPETHARRRAYQRHLQRTRSSESGPREKREIKRRVSKSELQRQLSRQLSRQVQYLYTSG